MLATLSRALTDLARAVNDTCVARCNEKGIMRSLREVVEDGNRDFRDVYGSVWKMIFNNDRQVRVTHSHEGRVVGPCGLV